MAGALILCKLLKKMLLIMVRETLFRTFTIDIKTCNRGERSSQTLNAEKTTGGVIAEEQSEGLVDEKLL